MEALWNIEDKWKLSTKEAIILFVCTAILVIGLCTGTALKMRARKKQLVQDPGSVESVHTKWSETRSALGSMKRSLMGSVRWSGANKWEERNIASWKETPQRLLAVGGSEADVGWQSHNSESPVWQRPILMGEKCELPRSLKGSVRWSGANKWEERNIASWKETPQPLLAVGGREADVGWQSHNSESPVWQRPILMGEKCELPRFSGLILYNERGQPLHSNKGTTHQEKTSTVVRTTLKDLL